MGLSIIQQCRSIRLHTSRAHVSVRVYVVYGGVPVNATCVVSRRKEKGRRAPPLGMSAPRAIATVALRAPPRKSGSRPGGGSRDRTTDLRLFATNSQMCASSAWTNPSQLPRHRSFVIGSQSIATPPRALFGPTGLTIGQRSQAATYVESTMPMSHHFSQGHWNFGRPRRSPALLFMSFAHCSKKRSGSPLASRLRTSTVASISVTSSAVTASPHSLMSLRRSAAPIKPSPSASTLSKLSFISSMYVGRAATADSAASFVSRLRASTCSLGGMYSTGWHGTQNEAQAYAAGRSCGMCAAAERRWHCHTQRRSSIPCMRVHTLTRWLDSTRGCIEKPTDRVTSASIF